MDSWANAKTTQNLKEWADKIRSCMIVTQAPNLIMQDQNFQPKSMYDIKANTPFYLFLNHPVAIVREETPSLLTFI